ncbi:MAG: VOC family protein [Acidobacteriota bacterium]|nr:VOC family protein [Acidobacteriota bacterium]
MDDEKCRIGLHHIGLCCRTTERADRFYGEVLGLEFLGTKSVPAELAHSLFGIDRELPIRNYSNGRLYVEIFLIEDADPAAAPPPAHVCLETDDLTRLLERCRDFGVPVSRASKGDSWVTFIRDDDGNLFEVKEAKLAHA